MYPVEFSALSLSLFFYGTLSVRVRLLPTRISHTESCTKHGKIWQLNKNDC